MRASVDNSQPISKREINNILEQIDTRPSAPAGAPVMDYCKSAKAIARLIANAPPHVEACYIMALGRIKRGLKGCNYDDGLKDGLSATTAEKAEALARGCLRAGAVKRGPGLG